jgi:hypothetical protein
MNRLLAVGLASMAITASASAQDVSAPGRQGFGISFGLGGGSASMSCDGCSSERDTGLSGYLRMGGYVSPSLFVGGETNGWTKNDMGVEQQIGVISAVVQWYPQPAAGLYLKGGAGFAHATATDAFDEVSTSGMAMNAGVGYDWRLTRNFSLTPYANYVRSLGAEAEVNGLGTGYTLNVDVLQFGLGFSWH